MLNCFLLSDHLTSSRRRPSTRSSHDATVPSPSSASGFAGLKVFDIKIRSFLFCYKTHIKQLKPRCFVNVSNGKNYFMFCTIALSTSQNILSCKSFSRTSRTPYFRSETYLNGSLEGLLNIQPLAHYCLVQLPFESQEIHVGLRLWDQFPDLCMRKVYGSTSSVTRTLSRFDN